MTADYEERRNELSRMQRIQAGPLRFQRGYVHEVCGGPAERAISYPQAYCLQCNRTVPVEEVRR